MERLKQLVEWFDNTPFEDMPKKAQKEISDGIVELIKYKALGTLDDLAALVRAREEGCAGCRWRDRPQKCSCCRRNKRLKDCYMAALAGQEGE